MTIVVWDGRYLAADKLVTRDVSTYKTSKITVLKESPPHVVAWAGTLPTIASFIHHVSTGAEDPINVDYAAESLYAIEYKGNTLYYYDNSSYAMPINGFFVIGSDAACFAAYVLHDLHPEMTAIEIVRVICRQEGFAGLTVYDSVENNIVINSD